MSPKRSLTIHFAIRWPGKITAGKSSNAIVHEMDLSEEQSYHSTV